METKKGIMLLLGTAFISGLSIFLNSYGVKGFDSSVFTFAKNIFVAMLLLALIIGLGQFSKLKILTKKQWLWLAGIGLVGGSIPFLLFFKGLQMSTGAVGSFIHKTIFVYVAVFALIFLKEKLSRGLFIGAVLLLAANYLMIRPEFALGSGHLLIFIATILWALENVMAKHVLCEVSGTVVAWGRMFFGSVFILIFLGITGKVSLIFSMAPSQYAWILVTALLLLGYVLTYYNGLAHVKVTTAACILALGSPITTLLDAMVKGTALPLNQMAGIVISVLAIGAIFLLDTRKEKGTLTGRVSLL